MSTPGASSKAAHQRARKSPLPVLGRLLEPVYRAGLAFKNARFDAGKGVRRFDLPVISIGNLSVGGTGKTPMVMHVVGSLLEAGRKPCIAMRGYTVGSSGSAPAPPDETDAYRRAFPDLPIVAQPDRTAGLDALLRDAAPNARPDCIILDDGFQHRQIARDLDVVLIDATLNRSPFDDRPLPAGWLREPIANLIRASCLILTHAELATPAWIDELSSALASIHGSRPIAVTRHVWTGLKRRAQISPGTRTVSTEDDLHLPLDVLIGARVFGCCAIGHPDAFVQSLRITSKADGPAAANLQTLILPDHDPFTESTAERLRLAAQHHKAQFIVVTDKDWSKLRRFPDEFWPCPILRPDLALVFDRGLPEFDALVHRVAVAPPPRPAPKIPSTQ